MRLPRSRVAGPTAVRVALVLASGLVACNSPTLDLASSLTVEEVSTGWLDAGIVNGQNKLVPTLSFRLKNISNQTLRTLQVNVLFYRVSEDNEWGSGFKTVVGSAGLAPGATSDTQTVASQLGYTGSESRQQMLQNPQFVDTKARLFAKYGSAQWTPIGEYPVTRRIITP